MRLVPLLVAGAMACGRLGFDPRGGDPGGPLVVEPVYPTSAAWNDYIRFEPSADRDAQAGIPCDGTETGLSACIHAGELRAVEAPALTTCAGSSAKDALDAFVWRCDDRALPVRFVTAGFRPGRGLGDLVDDAGWKPNHVIVNGYPGAPEVWWANPVAPLPDNSSGALASLADPGTVYVLGASRASNGYRVDADRVAVVISPGATLTFGDDPTLNCPTNLARVNDRACLIHFIGRRFVWIEGDLDARGVTTADLGLFGKANAHFQIHRLTIRNTASDGLFFVDARNYRATDITIRAAGGAGFFAPLSADMELRGITAIDNANLGVAVSDLSSQRYVVRDVIAHRNGSVGLFVFNGGGGIISDVLVTNNGGDGMTFNSAAPVITNVVAANNQGAGIAINAGGNPTLSHVLTAANGGPGLIASASGDGSIHQLVAAHNGGHGLELVDAPALRRDLSQIVSANNGLAGVSMTDAAAAFHRNLLVGANGGGSCVVVGASLGLGDGACAATGASTSTATLGVDLSTTFSGGVFTDDAVNTSDQDGAAPAVTLADWAFQSPFRTWMPDGAVPTRGPCVAGTCRIWDWRLRASDRAVLGRSQDGQTDAAPFAPGEPCPGAVAGDDVATSSHGTFLVNARELLDDELGDDDGLCETGEACLFSPSFGPYQGTGNARALEPCRFQDGAVAGVTMYAFPQRGE